MIPEAQAATKTAAYSPAIERAYAARAVVGLVEAKCKDYLTVNRERALALQKEAGSEISRCPTWRRRAARRGQSSTRWLRPASHGMQTGEMQVPQNRCLALLYAFGPEGTWIKGSVAENS